MSDITASAVPSTASCSCCGGNTTARRRLATGPTPVCDTCFGLCRPPTFSSTWLRAATCPQLQAKASRPAKKLERAMAAVDELDVATGLADLKAIREWLLLLSLGAPRAVIGNVQLSVDTEADLLAWAHVLEEVGGRIKGARYSRRLMKAARGRCFDTARLRLPHPDEDKRDDAPVWACPELWIMGPSRQATGEDYERIAREAE